MFARALSPFGSIGVVGALANVQREVGSLSSISAVSAVRMAPVAIAQPSHAPAPPSSRHPNDPYETSRRQIVVQGWTAQQSRKRQERSVLLGVAVALLLAASAAVVLYFFVPIRVPRPLSKAHGAPPTSVHPARSSTRPNSGALPPR